MDGGLDSTLAARDGLSAESIASDGPSAFEVASFDSDLLVADTGRDEDSSKIGPSEPDAAFDLLGREDVVAPPVDATIDDSGQDGPQPIDGAVDAPVDSGGNNKDPDGSAGNSGGGNDSGGGAVDGGADTDRATGDPDAGGLAPGWTRLVGSSPQLYYPAVAYDPGLQRGLLFGGYAACSENFATNQTWEWDGAAWTKVTPTGQIPSARGSIGMAFDSAHGEAIIHGGWAPPNTLQMGTYTYKLGTHTWAFRAGPPNLEWYAMAYDTDAELVRIFGGTDTISYFRSVRSWNATALRWQEVATTGPTARDRPAWVFDRENHRFVMFGGVTNWSGARTADTWEYDPATNSWQQTATTGARPLDCDVPPPMTYDPVRKLVVMYCYTNGGETWEYDGGQHTWSQTTAAGQTEAIVGASMFYDEQLQSVLLVGGCKAGNLQDATWRYDPGQ